MILSASRIVFRVYVITLVFLLASCSVGPEYKKPTTEVTEDYKESNSITWKKADPSADEDRGQWWKIFNDPILDDLIVKLNKNNQDIASLNATYRESLHLVEEARSAYLPSVGVTNSITSAKTNEDSTSTKAVDKDTSSHSVSLYASWELDTWGSTKYTVESDLAAAKANKAELASKTLSLQSSLAQYYFELRSVDQTQELLDDIVLANQKLLNFTKSNYKAGVMDESDLLNAENSLSNAESDAENNKNTRTNYEHAIAVLVGESPSKFNLAPVKDYKFSNITVPMAFPSELLERRPDISQAEELIKQANAEVGLTYTAFFPSTTISSNFTMSGDGLGNLLSMPNFVWSVGPRMALGLFDGNARMEKTKAARAAYDASVASYRQTVLSAFSDVEDQLSSVKYLTKQAKALNKTAGNSKNLLDITFKQYLAGIVDHSKILNSQITYYNAKKSAIEMENSKRLSKIALIKALGGGWSNKDL